jgi:hypothetical protein
MRQNATLLAWGKASKVAAVLRGPVDDTASAEFSGKMLSMLELKQNKMVTMEEKYNLCRVSSLEERHTQ